MTSQSSVGGPINEETCRKLYRLPESGEEEVRVHRVREVTRYFPFIYLRFHGYPSTYFIRLLLKLEWEKIRENY